MTKEALMQMLNDEINAGLKTALTRVNALVAENKALKEALAQPEQEPLGFMNAGHVHEMQQGRLPYGYVYPEGGVGADIAVYTTPPQRPWVGLTDEKIAEVAERMEASDPTDSFWREFARAIEAAHNIGVNT